MALSDWDTLAFDELGQSTNGVFTTPLGVHAEFYKNWLYISDEAAWTEEGGFTKPTIMQVNAGDLRYRDLSIRAVHGPWNGIYAVCWSGYVNLSGMPFTSMAGISCYGWDDDTWVGVSVNPIKFMRAWLRRAFHAHDLSEAMREVQLDKMLRFNQGDRYICKYLNRELPRSYPGDAESPIISELWTKP